MKYIRTKDGIEPFCIDEFTDYGKEYYKNCQIADTIEELYGIGDLLVVSNGQSKMSIIVESLDYTKSWLRTHDNYKIIEVYIKSENDYKGIAKMNDKGELELL